MSGCVRVFACVLVCVCACMRACAYVRAWLPMLSICMCNSYFINVHFSSSSQTEVQVKVYQGERDLAADNHMLGVFNLVSVLFIFFSFK